MKLIYHEHLEERDWIEYLLGDVVSEVIVDPDYHAHDGDVIQVVSGNTVPYRHRHAFFEACRKASDNLTLWHVSDEWLSGGYDTYRYFDRVIKNHGSKLAMAPASSPPRSATRTAAARRARCPASRIARTSGASRAASRRRAPT